MTLLLALMLFLLFAGLGFFAHVLWLGLIASFLLLMMHMVRHGLSRGTPTSRLNIRLVAALRGFLDDVLESRARNAPPEATAAPRAPEAKASASPRPAVDEGDVVDAEVVDDELADELADEVVDEVVEAEVVEDADDKVPASRAVAQTVMTPAKLAKAERLADEGLPRTEIARRLGVSRSTLYRHLAERRTASRIRASQARTSKTRTSKA